MNLLLVLLQFLRDELPFICRFLQFIRDLLQASLSLESIVRDVFELPVQILYLLIILSMLLLQFLDVFGLRLQTLLQLFKFIDQTVALTNAFLLRQHSTPALKKGKKKSRREC